MEWPIINFAGLQDCLEILLLAVAIQYALMFVRGIGLVGGAGIPAADGGDVDLCSSCTCRWSRGCWNDFLYCSAQILVIFQPELRMMLSELGNLSWRTRRTSSGKTSGSSSSPWNGWRSEDRGKIALEQAIPPGTAWWDRASRWTARRRRRCWRRFSPEQRHSRRRGDQLRSGPHRLRGVHISADATAGPEQIAGHAAPGGDRAADETDALVVVVSEETGSDFHAYKGHLFTKGVSMRELRAFLTSQLKRAVGEPAGRGPGNVPAGQSRRQPGGAPAAHAPLHRGAQGGLEMGMARATSSCTTSGGTAVAGGGGAVVW